MAVLDKLSIPTGGENLGTIMPKLQYRFRVTFIFDDEDTRRVTTNVVSATRPNLSHDEVTIDSYNSRIYLAGKHTWEPITIEMRDDVDNSTVTILDQQVARQIDMASQSSSKAGQSYKFITIIENLNGANPNPDVLDSWIMSGCYIQNLTYNESNYSSSEYLSINVTLRFDNAEHIVSGNDTLSGAGQNNDLIGSTI